LRRDVIFRDVFNMISASAFKCVWLWLWAFSYLLLRFRETFFCASSMKRWFSQTISLVANISAVVERIVKRKKKESLDRLHFVYPSRIKRNTQICVEVKQRREIAQFIQRKKECDPKDRIASHVCNYCTSWRENLKTFPNLWIQ